MQEKTVCRQTDRQEISLNKIIFFKLVKFYVSKVTSVEISMTWKMYWNFGNINKYLIWYEIW